MKTFLLIVEPLRVRAVHRWLEQQRVLLLCSRAFQPTLPPSASARRGRRAETAAVEPSTPNLLHSLHRPGSFRGRAMTPRQLLDACPAIEAVQPGDLLVIPHLPSRGHLSLCYVGSPGLVAGSSATAALPLGFAVAEGHRVIAPSEQGAVDRAALIAELPFPNGAVTPVTTLGPTWRALLDLPA